MSADKPYKQDVDINDKEFYTVLGAILDHPDLYETCTRKGISTEDFKQKVRERLQIELKDEQVENFRSIIDKLIAFKDSAVYFKPRC